TVRRASSGGEVLTLAGHAAEGSTDGAPGAATFDALGGVAVGPDGVAYVVDAAAHVVRRIATVGTVTTLAGLAGEAGSVDGRGEAARFNSPQGIAVDARSWVYVSDEGNATIRKISPDGTVTTLAGSAGMRDVIDGRGASALFGNPTDLALDCAGNLYV